MAQYVRFVDILASGQSYQGRLSCQGGRRCHKVTLYLYNCSIRFTGLNARATVVDDDY